MTAESGKRLAALTRATNRLGEMLARPKEEATRDSVIKRFELAFELAWKVMQDLNKEKGLEAANPKDNIRIAADNGFISDVSLWFKFLETRNLSTHVYDEEISDQIYDLIQMKFYPEVQKFAAILYSVSEPPNSPR